MEGVEMHALQGDHAVPSAVVAVMMLHTNEPSSICSLEVCRRPLQGVGYLARCMVYWSEI